MNKARSIIEASLIAEAGLDLEGSAMENQRLAERASTDPVTGRRVIDSMAVEGRHVVDDR